MMLWIGLVLFAAGLPLTVVDRQAARYFRRVVQPPLLTLLVATTDWAKGIVWIVGIALLYGGTYLATRISGPSAEIAWAHDISLALLAAFVVGSIILHATKLFLGRRRPRDDFEHGLYGFVFFTWSLQHNSFPSGHALTIVTLATWATALWPELAGIWFGLAFYLSLSRALLAVHFLSDVAIGAAIGMITTREILVQIFPQLVPAWF